MKNRIIDKNEELRRRLKRNYILITFNGKGEVDFKPLRFDVNNFNNGWRKK